MPSAVSWVEDCVPYDCADLAERAQSVAHRCGGRAYAVPFSTVRHTLSLADNEIVGAAAGTSERGGRRALSPRYVRLAPDGTLQGTTDASRPEAAISVPALSLAELLGYEYAPRDSQPTLLLQVGGRHVAIFVDAAFGDHEVIVRALPAYLRRPGVRGATVTLDGDVLLLLNVAELVSDVVEGRRVPPAPRPAPRFARARGSSGVGRRRLGLDAFSARIAPHACGL